MLAASLITQQPQKDVWDSIMKQLELWLIKAAKVDGMKYARMTAEPQGTGAVKKKGMWSCLCAPDKTVEQKDLSPPCKLYFSFAC